MLKNAEKTGKCERWKILALQNSVSPETLKGQGIETSSGETCQRRKTRTPKVYLIQTPCTCPGVPSPAHSPSPVSAPVPVMAQQRWSPAPQSPAWPWAPTNQPHILGLGLPRAILMLPAHRELPPAPCQYRSAFPFQLGYPLHMANTVRAHTQPGSSNQRQVAK